MTQELKRIKLADAAGWTKIHISWTGQKTACVPNDSQRLPLPNYFHDLNAVHELEKVIGPIKGIELCWHLNEMGVSGEWEILTATATQRAEAIGLTLNLWKA